MEIDKKDIEEDKDIIEMNYKRKSVYILHYPKGELSVSYGLINDIIEGKINHYCNTEEGSSGSPILSLNDMKVIGIHKAAGNNNYNKGSFLKYPIEEFISKIKDNKSKNEIICIYNKQKDEIILLHDFTNDMKYWNDEKKILNIDGKNNINEKNIDIYINDKKTNLT